jgi:nucleoside recognition membrane protein YjiH
LGYYKLVCEVNSSNSERSISDSVIIQVKEEPKVVKPDSKWLQNNVWSVVFWSIGSVCLVAIIVLLCIKPKTDVSEEPTEKKVKVKKEKKNKK